MAFLDDAEFKGELLGVLKDMATYLSKEDAFQARATIDKPPKIGETQKVMSGGEQPVGQPGQGVAKGDMVKVPDNKKDNAQENINAKGQPANENFSTTDGQPEPVGKAFPPKKKEDEKSSESEEELKSLLKEIKSALEKAASENSKKSESVDVKKMVEDALKAQAPAMMEKALSKMGFHPTKPDIRRYGIDNNQEVKKSEEEAKVEDIDENLLKKAKEIDNMSGKSFYELAQLREKAGGFGNLFH